MFRKLLTQTLLAAVLVLPTRALAIPIISDTLNSESGLGTYSGTFDYSASSGTQALITITLTNTTNALLGGFLTGFAFNNPSNLITGISAFSSTDADFELIGGTTFNNTIGGSPFGQFDVGSSTSDSLAGGGAPSAGLAPGASATFTFTLVGTLLNTITAETFFNTLSEGTGAGEGYYSFVARFRGFANGGSDKVPGIPDTPGTEVPEPATVALLSFGLLGAAFRRKAAN